MDSAAHIIAVMSSARTVQLVHSMHWIRKRKYRKAITNDLIKLVISNSNVLRDRRKANVLNAISRVPPSGRLLKVVYRKIGKNRVKIITAFWLD